jgi:hypothetical protein
MSLAKNLRPHPRVLPRIFRDVVIRGSVSLGAIPSGSMSLQALQAKPAHFLSAHLKRLCIPYQTTSLETAVGLLNSCTGLVGLGVWINFTTSGQNPEETLVSVDKFFSSLESLHDLRHLSFVEDNLVLLKWDPKSPPAWCARLKYLELNYWRGPRKLSVPLLKQMTSLTHLTLLPPGGQTEPFDVMLFEARPTLQVVLILLYSGARDRVLPILLPPDIRIIYREITGAIDEWRNNDRWQTAEEEIARRKLTSISHN